jgi:hypothetical protein
VYHYLGHFKLYEASKSGRTAPLRTGFRCPCKVEGELFDCLAEFVGAQEILPGESTDVRLSFLSMQLLASRLRVGEVYELCDGWKPVGEVRLTKDVWNNIDSMVAVGEVRAAVVSKVGWTRAHMSVEGGIDTDLSSQDVGLQPWDEIEKRLCVGDRVRVRVEQIDKPNRQIRISFLEKVGEAS